MHPGTVRQTQWLDPFNRDRRHDCWLREEDMLKSGGVTINRDYDRSVRFTILCFHVSILVRLLHTFSRVPLVSY